MDELLPLAMAGTQRRLPTFENPLFGGLKGPPEGQLLGAAALASLAGLAGQPLVAGSPLPADLQTDARPVAKLAHLAQIVGGEYRSLLPEWLELALEAGRRLDPVMLPELLEIAKIDCGVRLNVARVAGPRALWLAAHNPDWTYLLGESPDEAVWETGKATVRIDWLAALRQREPERARETLISSWAKEGAEDRARFLEILASGLSLADEDFLESALDDRSKSVRRQAAILLSKLPGSRLSARMAVRLAAWVTEKSGRLEVVTSGECGPDLQRDGVEPKSPRSDLGDKAWWLQQMVALAPLSAWKAPPQELLTAKSDWSAPLLQGWIEAAARQKNLPWARALIAAGQRQDGLFLILPREQQEQAIVICPEPPLNWLRLHRPYSPRLGQKLLQWMQARTALDYDPAWGAAFVELARGFPLELNVEPGWPEHTRAWQRWRLPVDSFIATVKFRQTMQEEMRR